MTEYIHTDRWPRHDQTCCAKRTPGERRSSIFPNVFGLDGQTCFVGVWRWANNRDISCSCDDQLGARLLLLLHTIPLRLPEIPHKRLISTILSLRTKIRYKDNPAREKKGHLLPTLPGRRLADRIPTHERKTGGRYRIPLPSVHTVALNSMTCEYCVPPCQL